MSKKFRVLRDSQFQTADGTLAKAKGEFVHLSHKGVVRDLMRRGIIGDALASWEQNKITGKPAKPFTKILRIGVWITTSNYYSGGRIHMYQYAWTMADLGAEVFLITNKPPMWKRDYPERKDLKLLILDRDPVPDDIDIIITDSKGSVGGKAYKYKESHPGSVFACMSFETPNWVKEFCPDYASKLQSEKHIFQKADLLLANSAESAKYLKEWVGKKIQTLVLHPAVNTYSVNKIKENSTSPHPRPYAVWSARSPAYKNGKMAIAIVKRLKTPLDLMLIGQPDVGLDTSCDFHHIIPKKQVSDEEKFLLLKHAQVVLAPSLFEGYGMVPGEALSVGTSVVAFDLPVLRAVYGDKITYAKWNDPKDYETKLKGVLESITPPINKDRIKKDYGMGAMKKTLQSFPYHAVPTAKKITAQLISYWGFIPASLESIYQHVDEIIVAYGPDKWAKKLIEPDGSLEKIQDFPDPDKKIKIFKREQWKDKLEMRSLCTDKMTGNYLLVLDGDEIWTGMEDWLHSGVLFGCPAWLNLWHGGEHWIYDSAKLGGMRWGKKVGEHGSVCPHYRWSYWRRSYHFAKHPMPVEANGQALHKHSMLEGAKEVPTALIYHLGHALPERIMKAKHQYYLDRDGADVGRRARREVWRKWKGETGDIGDGVVEKVDWGLPEIVRKGLSQI